MPVWISREKRIAAFLQSKGYQAYYLYSLKGICCCLRAGVYIYDNYSKDISFWLSGGAKRVNLWHGVGGKKINHDNEFDYLRHPRTKREWLRTELTRISNEKPSDYILATSPMTAEIFVSAFQTDPDHIIMGGYPRNDMLFPACVENVLTKKEKANLHQMRADRKRGMKTAVYMPTFRPTESMFFDVMDLERFNQFLQQENIVFYTKLHPKSKVKELFESVSCSNIHNIDAEVDAYSFLKLADLLITDYSSVYSDFLMLLRPCVLFPYDFKEYTGTSRKLYFPYEEFMPEYKAYTMEELMKYMHHVLVQDDKKQARAALRNQIFSAADAKASERLFENVCRIAGVLK